MCLTFFSHHVPLSVALSSLVSISLSLLSHSMCYLLLLSPQERRSMCQVLGRRIAREKDKRDFWGWGKEGSRWCRKEWNVWSTLLHSLSLSTISFLSFSCFTAETRETEWKTETRESKAERERESKPGDKVTGRNRRPGDRTAAKKTKQSVDSLIPHFFTLGDTTWIRSIWHPVVNLSHSFSLSLSLSHSFSLSLTLSLSLTSPSFSFSLHVSPCHTVPLMEGKKCLESKIEWMCVCEREVRENFSKGREKEREVERESEVERETIKFYLWGILRTNFEGDRQIDFSSSLSLNFSPKNILLVSPPFISIPFTTHFFTQSQTTSHEQEKNTILDWVSLKIESLKNGVIWRNGIESRDWKKVCVCSSL